MSEEFKEEPVDDTLIAVALKRSFLVIGVLALLGLLIWWQNREVTPEEQIVSRESIEAPEELNQERVERPVVVFRKRDVVDYVHVNGAKGEKLLPETMGGGVAVWDYDGDGLQDLLFVNGSTWPHDGPAAEPAVRLFRNKGAWSFEEVTNQALPEGSYYGQGVAVGDVDNDGDRDLFVSALGFNRFYRNDGGTFSDQTEAMGLSGATQDWSTSAGFFDYDQDGDLDLFVCNYVAWNRELDLQLNFTLNGQDRAYGPPKLYEGTHNRLYRNDGARFVDVSEQAGIWVNNPATGKPMGKALAVTFADIDQNGRLDILVACDTVRNFLFRNQGDGTFVEVGEDSGMGYDSSGMATGAMGMDAARVDQAQLAVAIANFAAESTSYYQQQEDPWLFVDMAAAEGIGSPSRLKLSFGLFFFDYDLDGRLDLMQANGHLEAEINEVQSSQHYRQAAQLFWNSGDPTQQRFLAVSESAMGDLSQKMVGRGAAYGDLDNDGDLDLVLVENGGPALVLENEQTLSHHWLKVTLAGSRDNRDAIGAQVICRSTGMEQRQTVMPTRSYLSQVPQTLTFGLGKDPAEVSLTIIWPGGDRQDVAVEQWDRELRIKQS